MRRIIVTIDVREPEEERHPGSRAESDRPGEWYITLSKAQAKELRAPISTILAHELGHIISAEFLSGPNQQLWSEIWRWGSASYPYSSIIPSEHEAWDIAELILFRNIRNECLKTYYDSAGLKMPSETKEKS